MSTTPTHPPTIPMFQDWSKDDLALFQAYIEGFRSALPGDTEALATLRGLRVVEDHVVVQMAQQREGLKAMEAIREDPLSKSMKLIRHEYLRAVIKHPDWPSDPLHALAIVGEEFGELTRSMLQLAYEKEKSSPAKVAEEALQTAAAALRLLVHIDDYLYLTAFSGRKREPQEPPA